jgi:hypothetical protein
MKKTFLLLSAIAFMAMAEAQIGIASTYKPHKPYAASTQGITFGLKAGVNFADLGGNDADGLDMLVSFHGGALVHVPFGGMWALQPEVLFSGEGAKGDGGKITLGYIRVPIMIQYVNPSGFYAEVGPHIGFLMSAKSKPDGGGDTDVKEFLKSTDFGVAFGLGYRMKNGFGFGGRYNLGLSNISDEADTDLKTSSINLGFFYMFGGEKK